jgi:hypothetical protein
MSIWGDATNTSIHFRPLIGLIHAALIPAVD